MLLDTSPSDTELIELLKSEDALAYTIIYNKYFDVLYLQAYQKLRDKEEAQDLLHELFAQLWNKRNSLVINSSLSGYLYTAVRNKVLDVISHQEVESKYIKSLQGYIEQGYCITDHNIREKQLSALIESGIASLPPKMREVFNLSRKDKLSHKEIAAQLNLSEQTVKKQINNALKILRSKLGMMLFISL
ncbi:RNA polymerase sigma-70 factor [Pedobacter frigiditerrae]|uniref:RNA polymerase sigma-70 factor n=1 Tax=Pedobacter frigiditerrae TaxID=2530452 RepID=A0A4R0N1G9_9SPHI|nr:RNA polymerase sigma-70 factor [Pedobacter frigiditerrae]TCC92182.1 RNA polymerase sigma-70 factor [Pedobacter frigiditerrae]